MALKQHKDQGELRFVDGLVAVDVDAVGGGDRERLLQEALSTMEGAEIADEGLLVEEFGDEAMVARVTERLTVFKVADPVAASEALAQHPRLTVSPIHALGFSWHRAYSATPPSDLGDFPFPDLPPGSHDRVIAVVDTGIVGPESLPEWMSSSVVHGQDDIELLGRKDSLSHGTFVASLIRQVAPTHLVSVARAADHESGRRRTTKKHPEPFPTTEFHVADAILRLVERHRGDGGVEALNLSVGGPALSHRAMATLQSALGRWLEAFPNCAPVFAAAGNSPDPTPIYPAASRQVRGVAAGLKGRQIVWDGEPATPQVSVGRHWIDDVAPGSNLIGLSGRGPADAVSWSGSSFATAVVSASHARGGPVQFGGGMGWWPNRAMHYGDVPGLRFV